MKSCFMFGHADTPDYIIPKIEAAIESQYLKFGVTSFYVGNRGRFDSMAAAAVKRVKLKYPSIHLYLLLSYHPAERSVSLTDGFDGSYYPPLEGIPKRYAIVKVNRYMIDTSDHIICYVNHIGNTRNLLDHAKLRQQKEGIIIENLAEKN